MTVSLIHTAYSRLTVNSDAPSAYPETTNRLQARVRYPNGQVFVVSTGIEGYASLKQHFPYASELDIRCGLADGDLLEHIFNYEDLPHLSLLHVAVLMNGATNTRPLHGQALKISLRKRGGFFAPSDVKMRNVTLTLDRDLCSGLSSLDLRLDRYVRGRISLRALFEVVRHAPKLTVLAVDRYLDVPFDPPRGAPRPVPLQSNGNGGMITVRLMDEPDNLAKLFTHISFPIQGPGIDLSVVVYTNDSNPLDPILDVLSSAEGGLPILSQATVLVAQDEMESGPFIAGFPPIGPAGAALQLRLYLHALDGPTSAVEGRKSGRLFKDLIHSLNKFDPTSVRILRFVGNMQAVPEKMWRCTLDRYANIRQIELKDMPYAPDGSLDAFFAALASVSNLPVHQHRPVCPGLVDLVICATIEATGLVGTIQRRLEWRTQNGAARLRLLKLDLYPDHEWSRHEKTFCEQALAPLVHSYEMYLFDFKDKQGKLMEDAEDWNKQLSRSVNFEATMRKRG